MGTELMRRFGVPREVVGRWHRECPDEAAAVYRSYLEAGAQTLTTNTLTAAREPMPALLVDGAVRLARTAARDRGAAVLFSIAPFGDVRTLAELCRVAAGAGADAILLETAPRLDALCDSVAAVRAARLPLPVLATVVCDAAAERTLAGDADAAECARWLRDAGADAIGVNCVPPPAACRFLAGLAQALPPEFPLLGRPSAGFPSGNGVSWSYPWEPALWAEAIMPLPNLLVGGCCGAGPRHIAALATTLQSASPRL